MNESKISWGKDYLELIKDKIYEVITVEKVWYRIIDETGEDYLYPPLK